MDIDIIQDLLKAVLKEKPDSVFINSLLHQYIERGGLSKKQLEGLHSKASKLPDIHPGKLATLEAIILKRPNRYKSPPVVVAPLAEKDTATQELINDILAKYPQHKRILFFKLKTDRDEKLTIAETTEVKKFAKLLLKA